MRILLACLALAMVSCYVEEPPPRPVPVPMPVPVPDVEPYCGDGVCDEWNGEDEWWCVDCGFDPFLGGPSDGGYCGDGHCFGYEDEFTCWKDCHPEPYNPHIDPRDPGWIDPIPEKGR